MTKKRRIKLLAGVLDAVGFLVSLSFPIWAALENVIILIKNAPQDVFTKLGLTLSGAVVVILIAAAVSWRFFGSMLRERVRGTRRTLLIPATIGYGVILIIKNMMGALESIFLGLALGAVIANILYGIADLLRFRIK